MSTTIRVEDDTRDRARALAQATGKQMQTVVSEALEEYERRLFWMTTNARFADLRRDEETWAEMLADREELSGSLGDRLD